MPEDVLAGTSAYWRDEGTGARSVVLLHCTMAHSGAWKGVMSHLGDACRMRALDLPAHGRSGPRDMSTTWQTQSKHMVTDLIGRVGAPVDLVGHSFGATVALRLALRRPDLVRSLTLIEPVLLSAARDDGWAGWNAHCAEHQIFVRLLEAGQRCKAAAEFHRTWGDGSPWEAFPEAQRAAMAAQIHMIRAGDDSISGDGPDYIPLAEFGRVDMPVLLIEGVRTNPIVPVIQDALFRTLPNARKVVVAGAGHMVPISHAEHVAGEIRAFLGL